MRLSIVVTTYNRKDLVVEAIDSELPWQRGPVDIEIIVVDDASSDGTVAHLQSRYSQQITNSSIRLVPLERNRGESGAKNAGAFAASGDWIVFGDSDDVLLPNSQSIVARAIAAHPERVLLFFFAAWRLKMVNSSDRQPLARQRSAPEILYAAGGLANACRLYVAMFSWRSLSMKTCGDFRIPHGPGLYAAMALCWFGMSPYADTAYRTTTA